MLIEELDDKIRPGGFEEYVKLLARIKRARKAAQYDWLTDEVKLNMYVYGLLNNPKFKEL